MSQVEALNQALKKSLRAAGVTYADVARQLDLSEATIKRCFASGNFTLDRLEQICQIVGIGFAELAQRASERPEPVTRLTPEQEAELTADTRLLLVAMLILHHWTPAQIEARYQLDTTEVTGKLLRLDRLGMIDLLPGNRVRHRVARHFTWRPNGPVQRYFEEQIRQSFFESNFAVSTAKLQFAGGLLSKTKIHRLQADIDDLMRKLDDYIREDETLPIEEKEAIGAVFAVRPWQVPDFIALERKP